MSEVRTNAGGVYIICGILETCCDTAGVGGVCCGVCETCSSGNCIADIVDGGACPGSPGLSCCGTGGSRSSCFDLQTDNNNCGSCGFECATESGENCCFGECIVGPPCS